jgi:hypothetical protein
MIVTSDGASVNLLGPFWSVCRFKDNVDWLQWPNYIQVDYGCDDQAFGNFLLPKCGSEAISVLA